MSLARPLALAAALLCPSLAPGAAPPEDPAALAHDDAEVRYTPECVRRAHGSVALPPLEGGDVAAHPWPFEPLSIGHTMASYQRYGGGAAYFHHGIDIRGDAGTPILAAVGGEVVNVANYNGGSRLYWEVAILDADGYLWQYHHVDHETIPQAVKDAFAAGGSVPAGALLGEIVDWPASTFGEVYHHVHLNVLGAGGVYLNPLRFLAPLGDDQGPEIRRVGLLDAARRPVSGDSAPAGYALYAEVADLVRHDKFTVPPYAVELAVDGGPWQTVWRFDSLPGGADRRAFVSEFYVRPETCGNYRCRRAVLDLGFVPGGRRGFPAEPGPHRATIRVRDLAGHVAARSFRWDVE